MKTGTFNKKPLDHRRNTKDACLMDTSQILNNAKNAQEMAFHLFPGEQWIGIDGHIFMAAPRVCNGYSPPKYTQVLKI